MSNLLVYAKEFRDAVRAIEEARADFQAEPETFLGFGKPSPQWTRHVALVLTLRCEMLAAKERLFRECDGLDGAMPRREAACEVLV